MKKRTSKNAKTKTTAKASSNTPCPCVSCTFAREIMVVAQERGMTAMQAGSACATAMVRLCAASPAPEESLESFVKVMIEMLMKTESEAVLSTTITPADVDGDGEGKETMH